MNGVLKMVEGMNGEVSAKVGEVGELCNNNSDWLVCKTVDGEFVESAELTIGEVDVELSVNGELKIVKGSKALNDVIVENEEVDDVDVELARIVELSVDLDGELSVIENVEFSVSVRFKWTIDGKLVEDFKLVDGDVVIKAVVGELGAKDVVVSVTKDVWFILREVEEGFIDVNGELVVEVNGEVVKFDRTVIIGELVVVGNEEVVRFDRPVIGELVVVVNGEVAKFSRKVIGELKVVDDKSE